MALYNYLIYIWFVIGVFEVKYLVSFIGSFDGTKDAVGDTCVGMTLRDITTTSDISLVHLK